MSIRQLAAKVDRRTKRAAAPDRHQKDTMNTDRENEKTSSCSASCACHAAGKSNRLRWIIGLAVLIAAAALFVRAVIKDSRAGEKVETGFAASLIAPPLIPAVAPAATNELSSAFNTKVGIEIAAHP